MKKILCLEDNSTMQILVTGILRDDFDVRCATTGEEFFNLLPKFRPDLVLLDIMLPDTNGHDVCAKMRTIKEFATVPVVMLSSNTDVQSRIKSYNVGAFNYISKPFDKNEFKAIIGGLLNANDHEEKHSLVYGDLELQLDEQTIKVKGEAINVTPSEFKLLVALVKGAGGVVDREKLTSLIKDSEKSDSVDRLINYHISLLRKKLAGGAIKIHSVYGQGYRLS